MTRLKPLAAPGRALLLALLLMLALPAALTAAEFAESDDHFVLPAGTTITEDFFVVANHIEILGDVEGELFAAGNIIEVRGNVSGTAFLAGNYVAVHGRVEGDAMVGANQLWLDGEIGQDVWAGVGSFQLEGPDFFDSVPSEFPEGLVVAPEARIGGDLHAGVAGAARIEGEIGRDLAIGAGGDVEFTGSAGRDADISAGGIVHMTPTPRVSGKFTYSALEPSAAAPTGSEYQAVETDPDQGGGWGLWIWRTLLALAGFALVLALSRKMGRDRWERFAHTARTEPGGTILWGIVSLLALPFLMVLLPGIAWALFGVPMALAVFALVCVIWFLFWFLSPIVSGRVVASALRQSMPGEQVPYLNELGGVLLLVLIARLGTMPEPGMGGVGLAVTAGLVLTVSYVLTVGGWIQSLFSLRS